MSSLYVLFIESEVTEQLAIQKQAKQSQLLYHHDFASSITDALSKLTTQSFDGVVLNVKQIDHNASELLQNLQNYCIPLIILAKPGQEEILINWLQQGAAGYLLQDEQYGYLKLLPLTLEKAIAHLQLPQKQPPRDLPGAMLEQIHNAVIATDLQGQITFWNHQAEVMYQWTAAEAIGQNIGEILVPVKPDEMSCELLRLVRDSEHWEGEVDIYRKDGKVLPTQVIDTLMQDEQGTLIGYVTVSQDISDRRQSDIKRHRQATLLSGQRQVLELLALDTPLSEILELLVHIIENHTPGQLCSILLLEGTQLRHGAAPSLPEPYQQAIEGIEIGPQVGSCGTAAYLQEPVIVTDIATDPLWENYRDIALSHGLRACWSMPIFAKTGTVLGTFALYHREPYTPHAADWELLNAAVNLAALAIERRQTEIALAQSEERFRATFEQAAVGICHVGREGQFLRFNRRFCEISGYTAEELSSLTFQEITYPDDLPLDFQNLQQLCSGSLSTYTQEKRYIRKDRSLVWINLTASLVRHPNGEPNYFIGVIEDITARKQTEAALRQSEQRYATLAAAAPVGIFGTDAKGHCIYVNDRWSQIVGLTTTQATGTGWMQGLHPADRDIVSAEWEQAFQDNRPFQMEYRLQQPNGQLTWVYGQAVAEYTTDGQFSGFIGTITDITDRKHTELALHQLNQELEARVAQRTAELQEINQQLHQEIAERQKLVALVENSRDFIAIADLDQQITYLNRAGRQLVGLAETEDITRYTLADFHFLDDWPDLQDNVVHPLLAGQAWQGEAKLRHFQTHQAISILHSAFPITQPETGELMAIAGILRDVTLQKQVEEQLRNLSDRLSLAITAGGIGIWEWDPTCNQLHWDDRMCEIYGIAPQDFGHHYEDWLRRVHPDDRAYQQQIESEALRNERNCATEFRIIRPDGTIRYISSNALIQRDPQGVPLKTIGLNIDITDHKDAEAALRASEHRFFTLTEAAPVAIARFDASGQCIYVNDHWGEMTGRPTSQALGWGWAEAIHPDDRDTVAAGFTAWLQNSAPTKCYQCEARLLRPDESILWYVGQVVPEVAPDGTIIGFVGTLTDITDLKQVEDALRASEHRFVTLSQAAPVAIFRFDATGRCIYVNDRWSEMTGAPITQALEGRWTDTIHPDDRELIQLEVAHWLQTCAPGDLYRTEARILRPDGKIIWYLCQMVPETDETGTLKGIVGTLTDITDSKLADQQLRNLSERLNLALESAHIGIWEWDIASNQLHWDDRMCALYGITPADFTGHYSEWEHRVHPQDLDYMNQVLHHVLSDGHSCETEFRVVLPMGEIRHLSTSLLIQRDRTGQPERMIGINTDITDRKHSEAALRQSEERLRLALEASQMATWDVDLLTGEAIWSDLHFTMLGYDPSATASEALWISHIHPEDTERVLQEWQQSRQEYRAYRCEYRVVRADNEQTSWLAALGSFQYDNQGQAVRSVGVLADITERKHAELALQKSEAWSRTLMEESSDAILLADTQGHFLTGNRKAEQLLGYTREEISRLTIAQIHPPEERSLHALAFSKILQTGAGQVSDVSVLRKDGTTVPVDLTANVVEIDGQQIAIGSFRDISARKAAERALWNSEARFRKYFELSLIGMAITSPDKGWVEVNDRLCQILGYPREELTQLTWDKITHPDDLDTDLAYFNQVLAGEVEDYSLEKRFIRKDGEVIFASISASCMRQPQGAVDYFVALIQDITRQKQAELELQHSEARNRAILEAMPDLLLRLRKDGTCLDCILPKGHQAQRFLPVPHHLAEVLPPSLLQHQLQIIEQAISTQELQVYEHQLWKQNQLVYEEVRVAAINPEEVLIVARDITVQKQAETSLRDSQAALMEAQRVAHIGNWEFDVQNQIITWSAELYRMFGLDPHQPPPAFPEYLQKIHPDDRNALLYCIETARTEGIPYTIDFRVLLPDGSIRYQEGRGEVIRNDQGEVVKLFGTAMDITERKLVELELQQNRDLRAAIFEESADALFIVDTTTELIVDCNQRAVQMFEARDKSDLINQCGNAFQRHPFSPEELDAIVAEVTIKGCWNHEIEYVTRKGKYFWANAAGNTISVANKDWRLVRLSDISQRKEIEELLQQQLNKEQLLVSVLMRIRDSLELNAILQTAVSEVRQLIQCDRVLVYQIHEDYTGLAISESVDPHWQSILDTAFSAEAFPNSCHQRYADGDYHMIDDRETTPIVPCMVEFMKQFQIQAQLAVPIVQEENHKLWGLLIAHQCTGPREWESWELGLLQQLAGQLAIAIQQADLYQRVQAELQERQRTEATLTRTNEQLQLANIELARVTRLKDEFLANMSHELRTPLNAVLGMTEALGDEIFGSVNEQQHKALKTIESSGRHLLDLINDILDLAKIESGKLEADFTLCAVPYLCNTSLNLVKQMAYKKNIQLSINLAPNLNPIEVDERRMRQVLINLLSNAIKFTPDGGSVTLEVWSQAIAPRTSPLRSSDSPPSPHPLLYLAIQDTGIGIAPEDMNKLFRAFVQIDSRLNRQYNGTGLGLALVKRITEMHGGWVELDSQLGQGSRFTVVIPYQSRLGLITKPADDAGRQPASDDSLEDGTVHPGSLAPQAVILLAEDNQANIETYSNYLVHSGYRVIVAMNGLEAVSMAQIHQPDLILMDIQMPEMDGLDATRQIRATPALADVPIIALTALAMVGDRELCLAAGANEYLTKPIRLRHLVNTVSQLLHH